MPPPDQDDPPDLGDWGASVTVDTGGNVRQVTANVAGEGPFVYEPGHDTGHDTGHRAPPQVTARDDERLRHDIDLLLQAIEHLRAQDDREGIAHAAVTVFCMANAAVHHHDWNESEGLADETRHWTAVDGTEGAVESFTAARGELIDGAEHLVAVLQHLFGTRDVMTRSIERGSRGGEALAHLARVAAHARSRLSFVTPTALRLLDEAIALLEGATTDEEILRHVLTVLSMTSNAMVGSDDWERSLADEYREWVVLTPRSGTIEQLTAARDEVAEAAGAARRDLGAWEHRRLDAGAAAGIAHALLLVTQPARERLRP